MAAKTVFQWSHYLALADEWMTNAATSQHPAAIYRSLISRAYYKVSHYPSVFASGGWVTAVKILCAAVLV